MRARRKSSKSGKYQYDVIRRTIMDARIYHGKPFCSSERSRIARLCQECRVGSFAATTYIPEYGITPGVRSPLISGNSEFSEESLPSFPLPSRDPAPPKFSRKFISLNIARDEAERLLSLSKHIFDGGFLLPLPSCVDCGRRKFDD